MDDFLLLFMEGVAPLHASLFLALGVALNIPFSWRKVRLSAEPKWIGLILHISARCWEIPSEKLEKAAKFLQMVQLAGTHMLRIDLERGTGLIIFLGGVLPMLRPWAGGLYESLLDRAVSLISLSVQQWAELDGALTEGLIVKDDPKVTFLRPGCRIISAAGETFKYKEELLSFRPRATKRTWVRYNDPRSLKVRVAESSRSSARLWETALSVSPKALSLLPKRLITDPAAADAWACGPNCGVGGWFQSRFHPRSKYWFSLQFSWQDLPAAWQAPEDLQKCIGLLESIAQTALLFARVTIDDLHGTKFVLAQFSDNTSIEATSNSLFTTKAPMKYGVQLLAAWSVRLGCELEVTHLKGDLNVEADELSRAKFLDKWDQALRVQVSIARLLDFRRTLPVVPRSTP